MGRSRARAKAGVLARAAISHFLIRWCLEKLMALIVFKTSRGEFREVQGRPVSSNEVQGVPVKVDGFQGFPGRPSEVQGGPGRPSRSMGGPWEVHGSSREVRGCPGGLREVPW